MAAEQLEQFPPVGNFFFHFSLPLSYIVLSFFFDHFLPLIYLVLFLIWPGGGGFLLSAQTGRRSYRWSTAVEFTRTSLRRQRSQTRCSVLHTMVAPSGFLCA